MSASKERLTVTVDPDLVEAASVAVQEGRSGSLTSDPDDLEPLARALGRHVEIIGV
jgi:hypothetical protein